MSNASGAAGSFKKFPGARCFLASVCLALCAPSAFAAPFDYVANYSDSTVSVIDLSTNVVVKTIPTAVAATSTTAATPGIGAGPLGVAINPAGTRVYTVNYAASTDLSTSGTVSVIDADQTSPTLNTVIATITVGVRPEMIAISPNGATAYVTNSVGNTVSVIDTATNTQTTTISVPGVPIGVALTPDGKTAYVTLADKSRVAVINTTTNTASSTTIPLSYSNPTSIVINAAGTFAYVADFGLAEAVPAQVGAISVIDLSKNAEVAAIPVDLGPIGLALSSDGSNLYVSNYVSGTVSIVDMATSKTTAELAVVGGPLGISVDSTGTYVYVNNSTGDSVSIIDLTANIVRGPITVGVLPNYSAITSSANLSVNLDQHGLTGAWYNPSATGLGFYIDVHPDANGVGSGILNAGWFTYDVTATGGQRWYWLQGDVTSTDPVASLTIYTGAGGNFNAAPIVTAVPVGQATLQFVDCMHGILRFSFSDGSNRQGFIGLTRLTGNPTCTASGDSGPATGGYQYSSSWYNPDTSGQGLVLTVDPTSSAGPMLYGGWFTYAPNGEQIGGGASQSWFALQSPQAGQGNSYVANIYSGSGGVFMSTTVKPTTTNVGTANVAFTSCTTMSLTYNFTAGINQGLSGTMNLVRLGTPPAGCQ